jgi:ClpP class serine protease
MNFKLAKEIYGSPWFMDAISMQRYSAILSHLKNNEMSEHGQKSNSFGFINPKSADITIISDDYDLKKSESEQNISIIQLDGAITKHGGASHNGTLQLASQLNKFDNSKSVIGHILMIESGGGSANAVAEMADAITNAKKPVVVFVDGMMASAAMYIGSYADYIYAKRDTDTIGSIGTMIEISGYPQTSEDKTDGYRYVRIYADQSTDKNKPYEEAINNLNFKVVKEKILNPLTERFINDIKANRPNVKSNHLTGDTFNASEVVGTLIDEIGTLNDAINKVIELSTFNHFINPKTKNTMNKQDLKQSHADVYESVMEEGANQERERVQAWMAFDGIDLEAVKEGISSGKSVTQKVIAEMSAKAISQSTVKAIEKDNATDIEKSKEEKAKTEAEKGVENFEKQVFASMNLKVQEVK